MKYNIILLILGIFMVMGFASAADDNFIYNTAIDYKKPCYNNGGYCSSDAHCNLTVLNPTGNTILFNTKMTNNISYHNYTIPAQTTYGLYNTFVTCFDGTLNGSNTFTFEISPSGQERVSTGQSSILIIAIIVMLVISLFFGILGYESKENLAFKIVFYGLCFIGLIATLMFSMVSLNESLAGYFNIIEGYSVYFNVIAILGGIIILAILLLAGLWAWDMWNRKRGLRE